MPVALHKQPVHVHVASPAPSSNGIGLLGLQPDKRGCRPGGHGDGCNEGHYGQATLLASVVSITIFKLEAFLLLYIDPSFTGQGATCAQHPASADRLQKTPGHTVRMHLAAHNYIDSTTHTLGSIAAQRTHHLP